MSSAQPANQDAAFQSSVEKPFSQCYQRLINLTYKYSEDDIKQVFQLWYNDTYNNNTCAIQWYNACWHFRFILEFFSKHVGNAFNTDITINIRRCGIDDNYAFPIIGYEIIIELLNLIRYYQNDWIKFATQLHLDSTYYLELHNRCKAYAKQQKLKQESPINISIFALADYYNNYYQNNPNSNDLFDGSPKSIEDLD